MQRWQCPIYNATHKSFVWSTTNFIKLFIFLFLYFHLRVLCKCELRIYCLKEALEKLIEHFSRRKTRNDIFHVFDHIKMLTVNQALSFLHGGSLKTTLIFLLSTTCILTHLHNFFFNRRLFLFRHERGRRGGAIVYMVLKCDFFC